MKGKHHVQFCNLLSKSSVAGLTKPELPFYRSENMFRFGAHGRFLAFSEFDLSLGTGGMVFACAGSAIGLVTDLNCSPSRGQRKNIKFSDQQLNVAGRFLCSKAQLVFFHRRQHAQVTLYSSGVVITDVALDHLHEFLSAGEAFAVIAFPFLKCPRILP